MTSVHPKRQRTLPGSKCHSLAESAVSFPTFHRWGNWGRVERWDRPWSPKWSTGKSGHVPWDPSPTVSAGRSRPGHPLKTQKEAPVNLWLLCQELPELSRELSSRGLESKRFMKCFFPFPSPRWAVASALGLLRLSNGGTSFAWSFLEEEISFWNTFKRTVASRRCVYHSLI